jgi:hypothetical protein
VHVSVLETVEVVVLWSMISQMTFSRYLWDIDPRDRPISVERRARVSETYSSRFRLYMEPERVVSIGKNPVRAAMVHVEVVVIVSVSADVEVAVIIVVAAIWVSVTVVESVMATESCRRG